LAGDYNHNDAVDAADHILWRDTLNSASQLAADGSGNGLIDPSDLGVWRNNFGHVFSGGSTGIGSGQSVPEPAAMTFVLIAAVGSAVASRRRHFGQRV